MCGLNRISASKRGAGQSAAGAQVRCSSSADLFRRSLVVRDTGAVSGEYRIQVRLYFLLEINRHTWGNLRAGQEAWAKLCTLFIFLFFWGVVWDLFLCSDGRCVWISKDVATGGVCPQRLALVGKVAQRFVFSFILMRDVSESVCSGFGSAGEFISRFGVNRICADALIQLCPWITGVTLRAGRGLCLMSTRTFLWSLWPPTPDPHNSTGS